MPAVWQGRVSGAGQCRSRCSPWSPQVLEALRIAVHGCRNSLMATTGCLRRFLDCRTRPGFHAAVQPCTVEWHPAGRLARVGPISGVADARSVAECLRTAPEPRRSAALIVAYGFFTRSDGRRACCFCPQLHVQDQPRPDETSSTSGAMGESNIVDTCASRAFGMRSTAKDVAPTASQPKYSFPADCQAAVSSARVVGSVPMTPVDARSSTGHTTRSPRTTIAATGPPVSLIGPRGVQRS